MLKVYELFDLKVYKYWLLLIVCLCVLLVFFLIPLHILNTFFYRCLISVVFYRVSTEWCIPNNVSMKATVEHNNITVNKSTLISTIHM